MAFILVALTRFLVLLFLPLLFLVAQSIAETLLAAGRACRLRRVLPSTRGYMGARYT